MKTKLRQLLKEYSGTLYQRKMTRKNVDQNIEINCVPYNLVKNKGPMSMCTKELHMQYIRYAKERKKELATGVQIYIYIYRRCFFNCSNYFWSYMFEFRVEFEIK